MLASRNLLGPYRHPLAHPPLPFPTPSPPLIPSLSGSFRSGLSVASYVRTAVRATSPLSLVTCVPALRWRCPALPPSPPFLPLVRPHLAATPTLPLPRVAAPASLASRAPTRAPFWHRSAVLPCRPPQVVFGSLFQGPPLNLRLGLTLSRPDRGLPSEGVRGALTPPGPVCGGSASYCPQQAPPHPPKRPRPTPPPPRLRFLRL